MNQERRAAAETCSASAAGMTRERPHRTSLARTGEREGRPEPWSPLLVVGLAMSRSIAALSARPSFPTARTSFRPVVAAGSCGEGLCPAAHNPSYVLRLVMFWVCT